MSRLYETAATLVYDPVAPNRNATRASLHSIGFRKVDLAPTFENLRERLQARAPDLLLVEVTGSETEVCALVQAVRQGKLGDNPFIVIIVTTWRRDGTVVGQVLNSGADDLIARPVSASVLGERIKALVERRKDFVVTMDYIGPDRRREARGQSAAYLEVPNPLKVRALDHLAEDEAERQIIEAVQRGKETLNVQKMRRDVVQLCLQSRMLEQRTPGARDFREVLPRIGRLSSEIKRRLAVTGQETARHSCDAIAKAVETLGAITERTGRDDSTREFQAPLSLLGQSALTLGRMFAPDEVEASRLTDLDRVVAGRAASPAAA